MTFTMSNTFMTSTMIVVTTTPIVVPIWGSVTRQNTWTFGRTVDLGGLDQFVGNRLDGGREDDHGEAGLDPDEDDHQPEVVVRRLLDEQNRVGSPVIVPSSCTSNPPTPPPMMPSVAEEEPTDEDRVITPGTTARL